MNTRQLTLLLSLIALLLLPSYAKADDIPYRYQRRELFRVLPTDENSIVFLGNSITNFGIWHEMFDDGNIVNRGISGNISGEVLEHLDLIVAGKPKKLFLMIGINDYQNEEVIVPNTRRIIEITRRESPETEIYIQSLLPCNRNDRHGMVEPVNEALKALCTELEVPYIDVYSKIVNKTTTPPSIASPYTNDALHVVAAGYRAWTEDYAQYVGKAPLFAEGDNVYESSLVPFENIMVSQFNMLPVNDGDILMLGDYNVQVGEWHELLGASHVKNRGIGIGWGYSLTVAKLRKVIPHAVKGNPSKIFVQCGSRDMGGKGNVENTFNDYAAAIAQIKELAPEADIYLQSLIPETDATTNRDYLVPFNNKIKALADADKNDKVHFVDVYAALADNDQLNTKFVGENTRQSHGINGRGYLRWANTLAPYCGEGIEAVPEMSDAKFALNEAISQTRRILFNAKTADEPGNYTPQVLDELRAAVDAAVEVFNSTVATDDSFTEHVALLETARTEAKGGMILPKLSTDEASHYYHLSTPLRDNRYPTSNGAGNDIVGQTEKSNAALWKFVARSDGKLDIVNYADGSYVSPASNANTALRTQSASPTNGWELKPADTSGMFIIVSATAQFNQTNNGQMGFKIYNWGNGNNTSDTGCQYLIAPGEPIEEPEVELPEAVLTLTGEALSGTAPYELTAEEAEKVFALESYTVAINITMNAAISGRGVLVGAADPAAAIASVATPSKTPYFGLGHNGTKLAHLASSRAGDVFTAKNGVFAANTNAKIVYTVNRTAAGSGTIGFYANGVKDNEYTYPLANYELPAFCDMKACHPNAKVYVGGAMANHGAYELCDGTIHSVQFFDRALTAAEVAAIDYDNLTDGEETSISRPQVSGSTKMYDLQGRPVTHPAAKGIYVTEGRKVLVR